MAPSGAHVLIVEDDEALLHAYTEYLELHGYSVASATDGEEAVSKALNGRFDVVVLDIMMPKLDGLQVLTLLRSYAATRKLPVITVSAQTGEHHRAAALDAGADLALEKPCLAGELEEAIARFVRRGRKRQGGS